MLWLQKCHFSFFFEKSFMSSTTGKDLKTEKEVIFFYFNLFLVFSNKQYNFYNKSMSCPSSIRRQDLNPRPLKHESSPITTIPGLPPKNIEFWKFELFWCWLKAFWGPSHFLKNCFPTNQSDSQCDQIWQIFANLAKFKKYLALYLRFIWH